MLHVPLAELPGRRAQEVLAQELRPRHRERHRVLELVAEAERAAGLVIAGARPHPAAQVLVEEPAVHEDVERVVGRADLHGAQRVLPRAPHGLERGVRGLDAAVAADQLADVRHVLPLADEEHEPSRLARRERDARRAAPRRDRAPRRSVPESVSCSSAAGRAREPFRPRKEVRSPVAERSSSLAWAKATRPANSWLKAFVARIAPVAAVALGDHVEVVVALRRPERPLRVREDGEAPRRGGLVRQAEDRELHRIHRSRRRRRAPGGSRSSRGRSG